MPPAPIHYLSRCVTKTRNYLSEGRGMPALSSVPPGGVASLLVRYMALENFDTAHGQVTPVDRQRGLTATSAAAAGLLKTVRSDGEVQWAGR